MPLRAWSIIVLLAAMETAPAAMAAPAVVSRAAPLTRNGDLMELDTAGHKLSLPLPEWLSDGDKAGDDLQAVLETAFVGGDTEAQVELFPKGQTQLDWKTRYGAQVLLQANAPLGRFRDISMRAFAATCPPKNIGFFQTEPDQGEVLPPLGFVCADYGAKEGPLVGLGEIALLAFRKTDRGVTLVYEDWRGAAFDAAKPATWPISTDALQARSDQFKGEVALVSAN